MQETSEKIKNQIINTAIPDGFKAFHNFNDEILSNNWKKLYNKGANYNLSYEWCSIWFKHFGKKQKLYIITLWKSNELALLAPFYIRGGRLTLIGTKPDLYDEFNILYNKTDNIDELIGYLQHNKLEINFRYVNCESEFGKTIVKRFSQRGIRQVSHVLETKPVILKDKFGFKRKQKDDNTRCKNNAVKLFGEALKFEFQAERKKEYVEEFIEFHKARWGGGLFSKKPKIADFLQDLVLNTDFSILSRLSLEKSNKTVAYHFGFMDSAKKFWSSMPTYDINYKQISPGKVLLYDLISEIFSLEAKEDAENGKARSLSPNNTEKFDFGRGSEPYKNWFSNYEEILFNITTFQTKKNIMKIRNFINKILR